MDVSVRELRNHTARVISAIEAGEPVVLTVHGRPVADITPRRERSERRPTELVLRDFERTRQRLKELGVTPGQLDPSDYDLSDVFTSDDVFS